jgi:hypothetical protein
MSRVIGTESSFEVRVKIAALWAVYMFIYCYNDYYKLFVPGTIERLQSGFYDEIAITQWRLLGFAVITIIPAVMIFLTLVLKPRLVRWLTLVLGVLHAGIGVAALLDTFTRWYFWDFYCVLMSVVAALVVRYAWRWPQAAVSPEHRVRDGV